MVRGLQLLALLQTAFMIWMMVDAAKRRADYYWFLIILLPFGEWIYFFVVKIHDFKQLRGRLLPAKRPSLRELRFRARQTPSVLNQRQLADGLHDAGHYEEAAAGYAEVLAKDAAEVGARYGAARCKLALGDPAGAIEDLRAVVASKPSYRDFAAWLDLAETLRRQGRLQEAVSEAQRLVGRSSRPANQVTLARCLIDAGQTEAGERVLREILEELRYAPRHHRRSARPAAAEARGLLRGLSKQRGARRG